MAMPQQIQVFTQRSVGDILQKKKKKPVKTFGI